MKSESCLHWYLDRRPDAVLAWSRRVSLLPWLMGGPGLETCCASLALWGLVFVALRLTHDATGWQQCSKGLLESLRQSAQSRAEIIDSMGSYTLGRSWRPCLLWGACWGLVASAGSGDWSWLPWCLQGGLLLLALLYCLLHHLLCKSPSPSMLLGWLGVLGVGSLGMAGLIVGLAGAGWLARSQAIESLWEEAAEPVRSPRRAARALRVWSENPVVVRELRREARLGPWGGEYLEFTLFLLAIPLMLGLRGVESPVRLQMQGWLLVGAVGLLQSCRAALTAVQLVNREKAEGTLLGLALTPLKPAEVVDGWALWSARARLLESLLGVCVALGLLALSLQQGVPVPPDCTPCQQPWFADWSQLGPPLLARVLAVPLWIGAATYLGILAARSAPSAAEGSAWAVLGLVCLGGVDWLGGPLAVGLALLGLRGMCLRGDLARA